MLAKKVCLNCLRNLSIMALKLSIAQKSCLKTKKGYLQKSVIRLLENSFSKKKVPAAIFSNINRKIKNLTGVYDPFNAHKKIEMDISQKIAHKIRQSYKNSLESLLLYSAAGNSIDFFKDINQTAKQMQGNIIFSKNSISKFKKKLNKAKTLLFFADNSGEMFFDLPLINYLAKKVKTYYVVKSKPVQNDLTISDLKKSNLYHEFSNIIASGNDAVGIELKSISANLRSKLQKCDLIIAKGMGYYETFTELPEYKDKLFYLLMAKCNPVATSVGVMLNDYVFTTKD